MRIPMGIIDLIPEVISCEFRIFDDQRYHFNRRSKYSDRKHDKTLQNVAEKGDMSSSFREI